MLHTELTHPFSFLSPGSRYCCWGYLPSFPSLSPPPLTTVVPTCLTSSLFLSIPLLLCFLSLVSCFCCLPSFHPLSLLLQWFPHFHNHPVPVKYTDSSKHTQGYRFYTWGTLPLYMRYLYLKYFKFNENSMAWFPKSLHYKKGVLIIFLVKITLFILFI